MLIAQSPETDLSKIWNFVDGVSIENKNIVTDKMQLLCTLFWYAGSEEGLEWLKSSKTFLKNLKILEFGHF